MLEVSDLFVAYGDVPALFGVSLNVSAGEIIAVLGSNGAGKSTLLRTLSGLIKPRSGIIKFDGKEIQGLEPEKIVKAGISLVPEGRRLFPRLTVMQNIILGAYTIQDPRLIDAQIERVLKTFPRLKERRKQIAGTLSGGEQQMVALARGLMAQPKLLMIDEMSLGLAPILISELFDLLGEVKIQGTTILLVEQNVEEALFLADRGYILQTGHMVHEGLAKDLRVSEAVRQAYLGL